jgi:hypothetical protein
MIVTDERFLKEETFPIVMKLEGILPKLKSFVPFGLYKTSSEYMEELYRHMGAEINEKRKKSCKKLGIGLEFTRDFITVGTLCSIKAPEIAASIATGIYLIGSYVLDRTAYYGLPFNLRNKSYKDFLKGK